MLKSITMLSTILGAFASIIAIYIFFSGNTDVESINKYTDKSKIVGIWDESKAKEMVLQEMKQFGGVNEYNFPCNKSDICNVKHNIHNTFYIPFSSGRESYIIVSYTQHIIDNNISTCHACSVRLSIFEFSKHQNNWLLMNKHINITEVGAWGEIPIVKAMEIGRNIFGVIIEQGYTAQGLTMTDTIMYAKVGSEYKEVFSSETGESNMEGYCANWEASIRFDKQGSSFYDLIVIKKGNKKDYEGNCKLINQQITYKFDGQQYSSSETYQ